MVNYSINTFQCMLADDAFLPIYKGSTFRGAFGVALRKVVCTLRNKECQDCLLSSRCIYAQIFEPTSWNYCSSRTVAPPHPYIIEPDPSTRTRFSTGNLFCFNLLLFGEFVSYLPYFIYAVETMGTVGIGKRIGNGRAKFSIVKVSDECGEVIYDSCSKKIVPLIKPYTLPTPVMKDDVQGVLSISLKTPMRFKAGNKLSVKLTFEGFIKAALRRVSAMHDAYGDGDPPLNYKAIIAEAAIVATRNSALKWLDWKRYSNRQDEEMLFGGLQGNISFEGNIGKFMQIIEQARIIHVGKQATFGLGSFDYHWEPE